MAAGWWSTQTTTQKVALCMLVLLAFKCGVSFSGTYVSFYGELQNTREDAVYRYKYHCANDTVISITNYGSNCRMYREEIKIWPAFDAFIASMDHYGFPSFRTWGLVAIALFLMMFPIFALLVALVVMFPSIVKNVVSSLGAMHDAEFIHNDCPTYNPHVAFDAYKEA